MSGLRVGVLYGGFSSERDVSLRTGAAVFEALLSLGHQPVLIDVSDTFMDALSIADVEVCYNALHGSFGEDGQLQSILEFYGMPYTGENQRTSLVAFDKMLSKLVYESAGVLTPKWLSLTTETLTSEIQETLGFPLFAKPVAEGSSVGVERIESADELNKRRLQWDHTPYLLEQTVVGAELSVACWEDQVIGSVEIVPKRAFYDYEAKYGEADTAYYIPPRVSNAHREAAERVALAAHRSLGCQSLCRTDVMVNSAGAFVLETNTLPGMTATSLVPKIAAAEGIDFPTLISRVLEKAVAQGQKGPNT